MQGGVFLLQDAQGRPDPNKVLKATFKLSLGGIAGMTHMEREWAVGRRLAPIEKPDKGIPGFMATGAAVVTRSHVFRGELPLVWLAFMQCHQRFCASPQEACQRLLKTCLLLLQASFWREYMAKTPISA